MVSKCGFNLHLSDAYWCWAFFSCVYGLFVSSLEKCLFKSFGHFLNWIVCLSGIESCEFFIYFGDQTLVWGIIGNYVFPYGWFPFHFFFMFSLVVQKLFNLMLSHLFILPFISRALGDISVKILLHRIAEIFPPMFSSRTFRVSQLIFKSFNNLELIFVYGVSQWSTFIFLHVLVQISQHHLLKRLFLLHFMFLPPLSNIKWSCWHGFVSGLSILFHWSVCLLLCQYQTILITVAL